MLESQIAHFQVRIPIRVKKDTVRITEKVLKLGLLSTAVFIYCLNKTEAVYRPLRNIRKIMQLPKVS